MPYIRNTSGNVRFNEDGTSNSEFDDSRVELSERLKFLFTDVNADNGDALNFNLVPYYHRLARHFRILVQHRTMKSLIDSESFSNASHAPKREDIALNYSDDTIREAQEALTNCANAMSRVVRKAFDDRDVSDRLYCGKANKLLVTFYTNVVHGFIIEARQMREEASSYTFDHSTGIAMRRVVLDILGEMMRQASVYTSVGILYALHHLKYGNLTDSSITGSSHGQLRSIRNTMRDILAYDDESEVEDYILSNYNFEQCMDCGEWESRNYTQTTYNEESVCRSCIDNNYLYSNYHDSHVHNNYALRIIGRDGDSDYIHEEARDDGMFDWDDEEDCYVHVDYQRPRRALRRYHNAKNNEAYRLIHSDWSTSNQRFFGIELEVECRKGHPGEHADRLNDALNDGRLGERCFFEEDGSLSHGFEIITQPMGLDSHYQFWEWLTDKNLTRDLRSHDTSTCGLHIHINRDNIKDLQINKMCVFIHSPDNRNLIKAIARRYGVGYASMHDKKLGTAHHASRGDARYEAVNLTNRRTIEMRIFKGTLKHGSMLAALEFTNALVHFTAPASPAGFVLNTSRFMDYINSNDMKADTRNLRKYLTDVGFTS